MTRSHVALEEAMPAVLTLTNRRRWVSLALLSLTALSTGACHRSTPQAPAPFHDDTVELGYGARERDEVGGAVQTVTPAEIAQQRVKRVEELLAGRVAGVRVLPTQNGGFTIRIRGTNTLGTDTEPLFVIDGMPITLLPGEGLNWLSPADILRIDVLKDPAETSMYGVRGANGVIVIKTKGASR
jgi:TonB-dependent SusC/RagA subfamily outer membrane receptor